MVNSPCSSPLADIYVESVKGDHDDRIVLEKVSKVAELSLCLTVKRENFLSPEEEKVTEKVTVNSRSQSSVRQG